MKLKTLLSVFALMTAAASQAQPTAKEWNAGVVGWNLGNQFECSAPGQDGESMQIGMPDNSIKAETAWGNPVVTKKRLRPSRLPALMPFVSPSVGSVILPTLLP